MHGDDRDTIYKTSYADDEGTEALTNYLQHDQQTVRDRTGRPMSKEKIEHLDATIKRLGELINVGRGVNCQAILSLQSIAQLEDTYGKERAHALLSGMVTVIGLRTADKESVAFLRETVGTSFEEYTRNTGDDRTPSKSEEKEEYQFAKGDLRNFDPGEAVICRQGKGWVHSRIKMLEE